MINVIVKPYGLDVRAPVEGFLPFLFALRIPYKPNEPELFVGSYSDGVIPVPVYDVE